MQQLYQQMLIEHYSECVDRLFVTLPGDIPPWRKTGVALRRGQAYTLLAEGVIHWSDRHPHLYGGPGFHLWARIVPGGRIVNVTRNSGSFIADTDGELELGIYLGMWRDAFGALDTPAAAYTRLRGELSVIALTWRGAASDGLNQLAEQIKHPLLASEIARIKRAVSVPQGWEYLPETGYSGIYQDCGTDHHRAICLSARDEQGIIRKFVDWELTPTTEIAWRWRLDAHPSTVSEDSSLSHDYVSVAAEFDNGRDLTWIWSSSLPRDYHFACPIKAWRERETHWVVRTASDPLATWVAERRRVTTDVVVSMGQPPPARIVAIWLIAVASFQHGEARARFESIELTDGERVLTML